MISTTVVVIALLLLGLVIVAGGIGLYEVWVLRHAEDVDLDHTGVVTVTITADTRDLTDALARAAHASRRLDRALGTMTRSLVVIHAGVEAKWWTRGALYASLGWPETCVAEQVRCAMTEELMFPSHAATSFLRGWVEHRPETVDEALEHARALPLDPHPMYDSLAWTCPLHGRVTTGDCHGCDDDLIASHDS